MWDERGVQRAMAAAHAESGEANRQAGKASEANEENLAAELRDFGDLFKQGKTPDPRSYEKQQTAKLDKEKIAKGEKADAKADAKKDEAAKA